jgi:hypothetical protein
MSGPPEALMAAAESKPKGQTKGQALLAVPLFSQQKPFTTTH